MKFFALVSLCFGFASQVFAFSIEDHRTITQQAYQELATCFPSSAALVNLEWLESGNINEDLDFINKGLFYSHYFHPHKKLQMLRSDSSARIDDLEPTLGRASQPNIELDSDEVHAFGHVIHHYQDMASPPHIVPVSHGMFDGFESFAFGGDISSGWTCTDLAQLNDPGLVEILVSTAEQTLTNVAAISFDVTAVSDGVANIIPASGKAFWMESSDNGFGSYGYLENNFGETRFRVKGTEYKIPPTLAPTFKQQQMRLAVQSTLRGLMWELGPALISEVKACLPESQAIADL